MTPKHIATYAIYTSPGHRVGTGYLYSRKDIDEAEQKMADRGLPFHMRWRNEECRRANRPVVFQ